MVVVEQSRTSRTRASPRLSAKRDRQRAVVSPPVIEQPSEQRVTIDALCARWRVALDAAASALRAAAESLSVEELVARSKRLAEERVATLSLLRSVARERGEDGRYLHLTPRGSTRQLLGLPPSVQACIFNLDGVLLESAALHAAAWTQTFDEFIWARTERTGGHFAPFDPRTDYPRHMHAKPRLEGVRAFLASRGISLPEGDPRDPPGTETLRGLAGRKNELLRRRIDERGVRALEGSLAYLDTVREAGMTTAVVSASANTPTILARSGLAPLIDVCIDGNTMTARSLRRKPAPDTLLAACDELGVTPDHAVAFETTAAGVEAARAAGFGALVGIDRFGQAAAMGALGAAPIVPGLGELLAERLAT
jgi:HAD superfamily hydrolase (TIGR01509 family)